MSQSENIEAGEDLSVPEPFVEAEPTIENIANIFHSLLISNNKRSNSQNSGNFNEGGSLLFTHAVVDVFGQHATFSWNGISSDFSDSTSVSSNFASFPKFASIFTTMKRIQKVHEQDNSDRNVMLQTATYPESVTWWKPSRGLSQWLKNGNEKGNKSSEIYKSRKEFQRFFSGFVLQLHFAKDGAADQHTIKQHIGELMYEAGLKALKHYPILGYKLILMGPSSVYYPFRVSIYDANRLQRVFLKGYQSDMVTNAPFQSKPLEADADLEGLVVGDDIDRQLSLLENQRVQEMQVIDALTDELDEKKMLLISLDEKIEKTRELVKIKNSNTCFVQNIRRHLPVTDADIFDDVASKLTSVVEVLSTRVETFSMPDRKFKFLSTLNQWINILKDNPEDFLSDAGGGDKSPNALVEVQNGTRGHLLQELTSEHVRNDQSDVPGACVEIPNMSQESSSGAINSAYHSEEATGTNLKNHEKAIGKPIDANIIEHSILAQSVTRDRAKSIMNLVETIDVQNMQTLNFTDMLSMDNAAIDKPCHPFSDLIRISATNADTTATDDTTTANDATTADATDSSTTTTASTTTASTTTATNTAAGANSAAVSTKTSTATTTATEFSTVSDDASMREPVTEKASSLVRRTTRKRIKMQSPGLNDTGASKQTSKTKLKKLAKDTD